jgi:FixJ family two-component response regulator
MELISPNVFVVDDDPAVLKSVRSMLESQGHPTLCFLSGDAFLDQVRLDQPGCLITDLRMPGIDGVELQRRMVDAASPMSVVVVTGYADVSNAVRIMENGAVTLLEKPYDPAQLLAVVERALQRSHDMHQHRLQTTEARRRLARLSDDELHVLWCAMKGMPNKAISRRLNLSSRTVDRRRRSALRKLQLACVSEFAILWADAKEAELHTV